MRSLTDNFFARPWGVDILLPVTGKQMMLQNEADYKLIVHLESITYALYL